MAKYLTDRFNLVPSGADSFTKKTLGGNIMTFRFATMAVVGMLLAGCAGLHTEKGGAAYYEHHGSSYESSVFGHKVADKVFFAFDSSALVPAAMKTLKGQAEYLKKNADKKVVVQGHCDERGTREYNLALGERRAYAVKKYLISQGVSAANISTISYGEEKPAVAGSNSAAWAQNRRAVTVMVK